MLPVVIIETLNLMDIKAGVGVPPVRGIKPKAKTELKRILKGLGAGQAGLVRVLELLEEEIRTTFELLGVTCWSELNKSYLQAVAPISLIQAMSAFPLLDLGDEGY